MKKYQILHKTIYIMTLTFILTIGASVSVMADDSSSDAAAPAEDKVVAETVVEEDAAPAEEVSEETPDVEPTEETPAEETPAVVPENETPADETPTVNPEDPTPAEETPAEEVPAEEVTEEEVVTEVVSPSEEETVSELGPASFYDPETGTTTIYYPDGSVEVIYDEVYEEETGELGPASFYDPELGLTSVYYPDGSTETYKDDTYSTASVSRGGNSYDGSAVIAAAVPAESTGAIDQVKDIEEVMETGFIAPEDAVLDESEVLGAYSLPFFSVKAVVSLIAAIAAIMITLFVLKKKSTENR